VIPLEKPVFNVFRRGVLKFMWRGATLPPVVASAWWMKEEIEESR
jgi:hypothetical protein